jgi:hypothetical protein
MAGACECGNEPSGSTECGEFLDQLRNCQLFEHSAPWACRVGRSVGLGTTAKILGQDTRLLVRDLNLGPMEHTV